ncbi:MAG: hypothetical protein Q8Q24_00935 [bacterium]|nr:hypothetical protein [bacterium]
MNFLHWKHKNIILFALSIVFAIVVFQNLRLEEILPRLGSFGYFGAFIGGAFFASTFTVVSGALLVLALIKILPLPQVMLFAIAGAITFDFLVFKFIKRGVTEEIKPIYEKIEGHHLKKLLHTKYFAWTLPVIGGFIIASPLPDELAVSLMSIGEMSTSRFMLVSILSHMVGISLLVSASFVV